MESLGVSGSDITIVGHSFGAQIAGLAGACIGDLGTIYALDPAGPLFTYPQLENIDKRLDDTDADWVSVIHTSSIIGALHELGDSDFYMDSGIGPQCGCVPPTSDTIWQIEPLCSHTMSVTYMTDTLDKTIKCKGIQGCNTILNFFKSKVCVYDAFSILGLNPYNMGVLPNCVYDSFGIYSDRYIDN